MKIALFTETYLPYINGVVTHVKSLHDGLEKLGHEVLIVTVDTKTHRHYLKDGVLYCPAKTLKRLYGFGLASPLSIKRQKLVKGYMPDVIHIHQEFGIGLSGALIARNLKLPLVYTMHTMYDDYLYYIAPSKLIPVMRKVAHKYFKKLGKDADALTGPSKKVQEYFDMCGLNKSVNVVPNPVELDVFNPSAIDSEKVKEIREKMGVKEDEILISFCGRLGKEKSVDVLLNNFKYTAEKDDKFKLLILGGGPCLEDLKKQAEELGISDKVIFSGMIDHNDLPTYYGCCQLYITASLSDTNSISMKEAMATGLPVIHIKDPLNAGQVVNGVNGYIYDGKEEMYQVLKNYENKTDEEKEELRNSVINSVKQYGCEALAKYLVGIYEEAIETKKQKVADKHRKHKKSVDK